MKVIEERTNKCKFYSAIYIKTSKRKKYSSVDGSKIFISLNCTLVFNRVR